MAEHQQNNKPEGNLSHEEGHPTDLDAPRITVDVTAELYQELSEAADRLGLGLEALVLKMLDETVYYYVTGDIPIPEEWTSTGRDRHTKPNPSDETSDGPRDGERFLDM